MRISEDLEVVPETFGEYAFWYEILGGKENNLAVERLKKFGQPPDEIVKLSDKRVRGQLDPLVLETIKNKLDEIGDTECPY